MRTAQTCPKKKHRWTLDGGRRCAACERGTRMPGTPKLVPLAFDSVYCELCRETIAEGQLVAWWRVRGANGRLRPAAYCADFHHSNVRQGKALR